MTGRCKDCRWFREGYFDHGYCFALPPTDPEGGRPATDPASFCSLYQDREPEKREPSEPTQVRKA